MNPFWRNLLITVLVALVAGGIGGWMGAQNALDSDTQSLPLRQTVHEIVGRDLKLTTAQSKEVQAIEDKYYGRRTALRQEVATANRELANFNLALDRARAVAVALTQIGVSARTVEIGASPAPPGQRGGTIELSLEY